MFVTLGWMLLAGLPLSSSFTIDSALSPPAPRSAVAPQGRVAVWTDKGDPYRRGESARVYLEAEQPSHVTVMRVDTDGRLTVLFPRDPWGDTYVREAREFEVSGSRGGRSFIVDDHPGMGYLFAIASARPFDFDAIARGDYWDYRLIEGGAMRGVGAAADIAGAGTEPRPPTSRLVRPVSWPSRRCVSPPRARVTYSRRGSASRNT